MSAVRSYYIFIAKNLTFWVSPLARPFGIFLFYLLITTAYQLLAKTFVTYSLSYRGSNLQDLSEVYSSYEILIAALASLSFVAILAYSFPLSDDAPEEVLPTRKFSSQFLPMLALGLGFAACTLFAFWYSGYYSWIEKPVDSLLFVQVLSVFFRALCILVLVYCDEYLFRRKILSSFQNIFHPVGAVLLSSVLFCIGKGIQFHLGVMHLLTLFFASVILGFRAINGKSFLSGAGLWAGFLILIHPIAGLPIFGNDFSGLILLKYEGFVPKPAWPLSELAMSSSPRSALFITGGYGGPLSSFALQLIFIFFICQRLFQELNRAVKWRKIFRLRRF